jgi:hypothetical protein
MADERRVPHNSHYSNTASDLQAHEHQPINTMTITLGAPKKPSQDSPHGRTADMVPKNLAGAFEDAMNKEDAMTEEDLDPERQFNFDDEDKLCDVQM